MHHRFIKTLSASALALMAMPVAAQVDHLVMSEVAMITQNQNGSYKSSEYVEIYNPTASAIPLDNYYYTDHNSYKSFPANPGGMDIGTSDQIAGFPAGTMLASGQIVVITGGAELFLKEFFPSDGDPNVGDLAKFNALPGSPLLFEVEETMATVPNTINFNTAPETGDEGQILKNNLSMTNGAEFSILFHWDGVSDLVQDVDIVTWGIPNATTTNRFAPKTTADTGANGATYLNDAGNHDTLSVAGDTQNNVIVRQTILETDEVDTGGNGLTGHDETTENTPVTWAAGPHSLTSPGVTHLGIAGQNLSPVISAAGQTPMDPVAGAPFTVTIAAEDSDGLITGGTVFYNTDGGATFNSVAATVDTPTTLTATMPAMADNTTVYYYVEVTDDGGGTSLFPFTAPTDLRQFVVRDNPILDGDLVINEILGNNIGGDAYEFVELHNTTDNEMDITGFRFADLNLNYFSFPAGTKVQADGYVIMTLGRDEFLSAYPDVPQELVYDWGGFGLNNGGDTIFLVSPNGYDYMGSTVNLDTVTWVDAAGTDWPRTSPGSTGRTYELRNPALDNDLPESWAAALLSLNGSDLPGTPGAKNLNYTVANTDLFFEEPFPAANASFPVDLGAEAIGSATITGIDLVVDPGTGTFGSPIAMTVESGTTYTATLPGYANDTDIKYYFELTNSDGETSLLPADGDNRPLVFKITDNQVQRDDVVINEILFNNNGADAYEYLELYNTTTEPIDVGYLQVLTLANNPYTIPEGTTIPADDYLVISMNSFNFFAAYGENPDLEWGGLFNLDNDGDNVRLIHPNQYDPSGDSTPVDFVQYGIAPPWPDQSSEFGSEATGASIELINPTFPDRGTNGERWLFTTNVPNDFNPLVMGTPGALNSSYSGVSDWTLY